MLSMTYYIQDRSTNRQTEVLNSADLDGAIRGTCRQPPSVVVKLDIMDLLKYITKGFFLSDLLTARTKNTAEE